MIKKKTIRKLKNKYRMVIYNDATFAESFSLRLTRLNVYAVAGSLIILFMVIGMLLMIYTPLRYMIPGYGHNDRQIMIKNVFRLDSLEKEIEHRDFLYENVLAVMKGEQLPVPPYTDSLVVMQDTVRFIPHQKTKADSILRSTVEQEEQFNLHEVPLVASKESFPSLYMYRPVEGVLTFGFDNTYKHYGVDIAAPENSQIMAVLEGTVINTSWTVETGNVIYIQHNENLISIYKHCSELLKTTGDRIKTGEVIAVVGNTGELTDGPHLHFELWYRGVPLNPENFIAF